MRVHIIQFHWYEVEIHIKLLAPEVRPVRISAKFLKWGQYSVPFEGIIYNEVFIYKNCIHLYSANVWTFMHIDYTLIKKKSVNGMKCSNGSSAQQFAYMAYVSIALAAK